MKTTQNSLRLTLESLEQDRVLLQDGQGIAALEQMQVSLENYLLAADQLSTMATGLEKLAQTVESIPQLDAGHLALLRVSAESLLGDADMDIGALVPSLEDAASAEGGSRLQRLKAFIVRMWEAAKSAFLKVWEYVLAVFRRSTDVEKELLLKIGQLQNRLAKARHQVTKSPQVQLTHRHAWLSVKSQTPRNKAELNKLLTHFATMYGFMGDHFVTMLKSTADELVKVGEKIDSDPAGARKELQAAAVIFSPDSMVRLVPGAYIFNEPNGVYGRAPIISDRQLVVTGAPLRELTDDKFVEGLKKIGISVSQEATPDKLSLNAMDALSVQDIEALLKFATTTLEANRSRVASSVSQSLGMKFKALTAVNDRVVEKLSNSPVEGADAEQKLLAMRELAAVTHLLSKWAAAPLTQFNLIVMHVMRALLSLISLQLENYEGMSAEPVKAGATVESHQFTFEGEGEEVLDIDTLDSEEPQENDVVEEVSFEASVKELKNGMKISFSHGHGKIAKVFTAPFKLDGKHHHASKDAPLYLVKHDKGGKHSLHKASALKPRK